MCPYGGGLPLKNHMARFRTGLQHRADTLRANQSIEGITYDLPP